jgi:hypothetical protein
MYLSSTLSSSLFLLLYFYRINASDVSVSESELFMLVHQLARTRVLKL